MTSAPTSGQPAPSGGTATRRRSGASFGTDANYRRMTATYPAPTVPPPSGWTQQPDGSWWSWDGSQWNLQPQGPAPSGAGVATFSADGALNKAGLLVLIAVATGVVAALSGLPVGVAGFGVVAGLGTGLWCSFQPRRAPVLAPIFAVVEGVVLGVVSRFYVTSGSSAVVMAVVGTAAMVVGVWTVYRTGLVRVGPRFLQMTLVGGLAMVVVMVVAMLTGWGTTGTAGLLIFGVLYLILGIANLFVDFSFVERAEQAGLEADAEWFSAFSILLSTVMVYLALLRIFGGRQ